jgi:hypothetical protein
MHFLVSSLSEALILLGFWCPFSDRLFRFHLSGPVRSGSSDLPVEDSARFSDTGTAFSDRLGVRKGVFSDRWCPDETVCPTSRGC